MFDLDEFLKHFERVRERTRRVAACIPSDHVEWTYDGAVSCADARHARREVPHTRGREVDRWKWLRMMPEHEIHHRGQLDTMLGMLNVPTPPLYGMTSSDVRALSLRHP
jgi:uncharacterized damage-inducible protein DinB